MDFFSFLNASWGRIFSFLNATWLIFFFFECNMTYFFLFWTRLWGFSVNATQEITWLEFFYGQRRVFPASTRVPIYVVRYTLRSGERKKKCFILYISSWSVTLDKLYLFSLVLPFFVFCDRLYLLASFVSNVYIYETCIVNDFFFFSLAIFCYFCY